jgi:hypothetical protein
MRLRENLGVAASEIHLGEDASETTVERTPLAAERMRRQCSAR